MASERKVDFAICGTQKGGTTALHAYLAEHPQIGLAREKEVHFFDTEKHFAGATPDYAAYHASFSPEAWAKPIRGEATPIYMYWNPAPARIAAYNPDMKLIVLLRNPITRAYSHWNMERSRGNDSLPFWDALQGEKARCAEVAPLQHRIFSYTDRSFYSGQIRRLWQHFPQEQVLIMKNDDIKKAPQQSLDRICAYLGIAPMQVRENKTVHAIAYEEPMQPRERDYLRELFTPEIRELEQLLGWDCSGWLK
jgi:hypothetical protein